MLDFGKIKVFMVKFLESILTETFLTNFLHLGIG